MQILVTGAKGFIGRNLIAQLGQKGYTDILEYDIDTPAKLLEDYTSRCGFVFHLAGVNRPKQEQEFMDGNYSFTLKLIEALEQSGNICPVLYSSSVQAAFDNPYGRSKKAGEEAVFEYGRRNRTEVFVYRLPNVFGKWCRPDYNSAVATFCHNIANGLPITVNDGAHTLSLAYIDDIVDDFIYNLSGETSNQCRYYEVSEIYTRTLEQIVRLLYSFKEVRAGLGIPKLEGDFEKKLYGTFVSYYPPDKLDTPLVPHADDRGSFTELFRTGDRGQLSVNIIKPGYTKGNHWHNRKSEKFIAVNGSGTIRLQRTDGDESAVYRVSGECPTVVDIPPGYVHSITNDGEGELTVVIWISESYSPEDPDTYYVRL